MARRSLVSVQLRLESAEARASTRDLRREIDRDVKEILREVAQRRVVPAARRRAPSIVADTIVARATTRSVYLTTSARGKLRRIFGLLEFGGTVRRHIKPRRRKKALRFIGPSGETVYAARVRSPRTYEAKLFMRAAVEAERAGVLRELEREIPRAMRRRLRGVATVVR